MTSKTFDYSRQTTMDSALCAQFLDVSDTLCSHHVASTQARQPCPAPGVLRSIHGNFLHRPIRTAGVAPSLVRRDVLSRLLVRNDSGASPQETEENHLPSGVQPKQAERLGPDHPRHRVVECRDTDPPVLQILDAAGVFQEALVRSQLAVPPQAVERVRPAVADLYDAGEGIEYGGQVSESGEEGGEGGVKSGAHDGRLAEERRGDHPPRHRPDDRPEERSDGDVAHEVQRQEESREQYDAEVPRYPSKGEAHEAVEEGPPRLGTEQDEGAGEACGGYRVPAAGAVQYDRLPPRVVAHDGGVHTVERPEGHAEEEEADRLPEAAVGRVRPHRVEGDAREDGQTDHLDDAEGVDARRAARLPVGPEEHPHLEGEGRIGRDDPGAGRPSRASSVRVSAVQYDSGIGRVALHFLLLLLFIVVKIGSGGRREEWIQRRHGREGTPSAAGTSPGSEGGRGTPKRGRCLR
mmetsp:Transcript_15887/g.45664  ORF Transcript_15887/g.45664 Transcript_15887/m.45664 type:complete len:464 (-) Transcript_15887:441-1832(-)